MGEDIIVDEEVDRGDNEVMTKLKTFARAIEVHEGRFAPCKDYPKGSRSWRNNNSGNFKLTPLIKELGATGVDRQGFAIFPTYRTGFDALMEFVKMACNNQLKSYKNKTVLGFFKVYAPSSDSNNPTRYAQVVAKAVGTTIDTPMKSLLS